MAEPLRLSYVWQTPIILGTIAALICIAFVVFGHAVGRWPVAAVVVLLWAALLAWVYGQTRAFLRVDGSTLTARRFRTMHVVEGAQVRRVTEYLTRRGPSYRLHVAWPDGRTSKVIVPSSLLQGGHSTLFTWLLSQAPQADLDRGATKTLEKLRIRGLVE